MKLKLVVCNHKGGAGKTTLAMLLAANLSSDSYRVAVIDLDPQASAQLWAQAGEGRFPAHVVGATAETMAAVLASLAEFDAIVIDCPPSSTAAATLAAVDVADLIVIPCQPSALDFWATEAMTIAADMRRPETPRLVVVNQMGNTSLSKELAGHIKTSWPTARARLGARIAFKEAAAQGCSLRQLPGRSHRLAIAEMDALSLEVLATATKAAQ